MQGHAHTPLRLLLVTYTAGALGLAAGGCNALLGIEDPVARVQGDGDAGETPDGGDGDAADASMGPRQDASMTGDGDGDGDGTDAATPAPTCQGGTECAPMLVAVAGGAFSMGSPDGELGHADDEPAHQVTVSPFRIDHLEVTNSAYLDCVLDDVCESPTTCDSGVPDWKGPVSFASELALHPVSCVTWAMATAYCEWSDKRLCSEAEWEYAAVDGTHRAYPWGDEFPVDPDRYLNCDESYCFDGHADTSAVGTFAAGATPGGLLDMAGNVSEWTLDYYDPDYYDTGLQLDPRGPCDASAPCGALFTRVHRGGNFDSHDDFVRTAKRAQRAETSRERYIGIRCCADAQ